MYTFKTRERHPLGIYLLPVLLFLAPPPSRGETLVLFDFDDTVGNFENLPEQIAAHLTAGGWSDVDGTLTDFTGNPGRAVAARSFDDGNTLQFALVIQPGFVLRLEGYAFDQRVSSQGPTQWTLSVASSVVAAGTTTDVFASRAGGFLVDGLSGAVDIALDASGGTTTTGTLRLDNFSLHGQVTPIPLPSGGVLLGSAAALLGATMRRWRQT